MSIQLGTHRSVVKGSKGHLQRHALRIVELDSHQVSELLRLPLCPAREHAGLLQVADNGDAPVGTSTSTAHIEHELVTSLAGDYKVDHFLYRERLCKLQLQALEFVCRVTVGTTYAYHIGEPARRADECNV